jgi:hypothetical protein
MLLKFIFYFIIFYFIFRAVRWFMNLNSTINKMNKPEEKQQKNSNEKYSGKEIEDAEYEEIK